MYSGYLSWPGIVGPSCYQLLGPGELLSPYL
jgi:hypothetical protein